MVTYFLALNPASRQGLVCGDEMRNENFEPSGVKEREKRGGNEPHVSQHSVRNRTSISLAALFFHRKNKRGTA